MEHVIMYFIHCMKVGLEQRKISADVLSKDGENKLWTL